MSRYDGLIIPRSYSEYINKTDAATLQQALQLSGVLSGTVAAGDNKAVKSDAVNALLGNKVLPMDKNTLYKPSILNNTWYRLAELPNIPSGGSTFLFYINKLYVTSFRSCALLIVNYGRGNTTMLDAAIINSTRVKNFSKLRIVQAADEKYYLEAYITRQESFNTYLVNITSTEKTTDKTVAEETETELVQIDI